MLSVLRPPAHVAEPRVARIRSFGPENITLLAVINRSMNGAIRLKQFTARPNAGDAASAVIVSELGGEDVLVVGEEPCGAPNLIAIGSILHWADPNSVIWGTGLIHEGVPLIPPLRSTLFGDV